MNQRNKFDWKHCFVKSFSQYRYRKVHEMFDLAKVEFCSVVWSVRPVCWQQCCWRRCCRRLLSGGRITVCLVAVSSPGLLSLLPVPGLATRASNEPSRIFHNHGEDSTRAFFWLKAPTSFHSPLGHYKDTILDRNQPTVRRCKIGMLIWAFSVIVKSLRTIIWSSTPGHHPGPGLCMAWLQSLSNCDQLGPACLQCCLGLAWLIQIQTLLPPTDQPQYKQWTSPLCHRIETSVNISDTKCSGFCPKRKLKSAVPQMLPIAKA